MTVYFIRRKGVAAGPIKIGYAVNLEKRIKTLLTATPEGFEIIGTIDAGRGVEKALHRELADFCIGGEWFAPSSEVLAAIEQAKSGRFDHEDNHRGPRPIISEPQRELEANIVDETRFYLNELIKREHRGSGDTLSAARDRVMTDSGLSTKYGFRLWSKSQELSDVPGEVYRCLRLAYALACEKEGRISDMQARHLAFVRRERALHG